MNYFLCSIDTLNDPQHKYACLFVQFVLLQPSELWHVSIISCYLHIVKAVDRKGSIRKISRNHNSYHFSSLARLRDLFPPSSGYPLCLLFYPSTQVSHFLRPHDKLLLTCMHDRKLRVKSTHKSRSTMIGSYV